MTAAARMMRLARKFRSPRDASTCAVIPTLVATMAAPMKMLSTRGSPHMAAIHHPSPNGMMTPIIATRSAVPPTFSRSEDFTSSPTRNSRNITPRSERIRRTSLGAIQPST